MLTYKEARKFMVLLVAIVLMGIFELVGIASIMPFMQLVSQPEAIENNPLLGEVYAFFEFDSEKQFLIALSFAVLALLTIANLLTVFTLWLQHKFAWDSAHSLATRLLEKYLHQPYSFFLKQNSSELSKQILSDTTELARGFLLSIAVLVARAVVAVAIFSLLLLVNPWLAITMFAVFGSIYAVMYANTRKYLSKLGDLSFEANERRFKSAGEVFQGIKTVKITGRESFFEQRFEAASLQFSNVEPKREAMYVAPVYFIQTLAFGAIIVLILYLLATEGSLQDVIPLLSLYALAGYRLLPSLQQFYGALNKIRYQKPIVDAVFKDLQTYQVPAIHGDEVQLNFEKQIHLKNLGFKYAGAEDYAIKGLDLTIDRNQSVAFVGTTGSGKTTLVDLLAGLLSPIGGSIAIDGQKLDEHNVRAWQKKIGYVPQEVTLYDDSIARNIAFGVPAGDIDMKRIKEVALIAEVHDFIMSELPEGYNTYVGERGIRLSGGQRQRLGLARALYARPEVLILDEATSALDGITEASVMAGIARSMDNITTIMIAHRLDTVKDCDVIFMMEKGKIVSRGSYESLMSKNEAFRRMARIEPRLDFRKMAT